MCLIINSDTFYDERGVKASKSTCIISVTCVTFKHYDSIGFGLNIDPFFPGWGRPTLLISNTTLR